MHALAIWNAVIPCNTKENPVRSLKTATECKYQATHEVVVEKLDLCRQQVEHDELARGGDGPDELARLDGKERR